MNSQTQTQQVAGPAGALHCAIDQPAQPAANAPLALICHPHPLHGGTLDNKVVQTVARAFLQLGCVALRFNFRGVAPSQGQWDEGQGEVDDAQAVLDAHRQSGQPVLLAGFSFGGYVAAALAQRLAAGDEVSKPKPQRLVLVAPAVSRFAVPTVPAGTVVIHGEQDEVVPLSASLDWARPQGLPITVVPGVGHFFHGQLPLLRQIVLDACR